MATKVKLFLRTFRGNIPRRSGGGLGSSSTEHGVNTAYNTNSEDTNEARTWYSDVTSTVSRLVLSPGKPALLPRPLAFKQGSKEWESPSPLKVHHQAWTRRRLGYTYILKRRYQPLELVKSLLPPLQKGQTVTTQTSSSLNTTETPAPSSSPSVVPTDMPATEQSCHGNSSMGLSIVERDDPCTTEGKKCNLSVNIPAAAESRWNSSTTPSPAMSTSSTSSFNFNSSTTPSPAMSTSSTSSFDFSSGFESQIKHGTQESNTQGSDGETVTGVNLPSPQDDITSGSMPTQLGESTLEDFSNNSKPKHFPNFYDNEQN